MTTNAQPAPGPRNAQDHSSPDCFAVRNLLIREKLDPHVGWKQRRHPIQRADGQRDHAVTVERQTETTPPAIVKSMRGFMGVLQAHELRAYLDVFNRGDQIPRIATFDQLARRQSDLTHKIITLKDYGPDLADWFTLIGPPRLAEQYHDPGIPLRDTPRSPLLKPEHLLALARALLEALEPFHRLGFVHCDVKTDNFCIGLTPAPTNPSGPVLRGEIDLDSLTAIDLGCCLLPTETYGRVIYRTEEQAPLYIGAGSRRTYTWAVLMGAENETQAQRKARIYAAGGYPAELNTPDLRQQRRRILSASQTLAYVSDHYLLASEMAALGEPAALMALDWRVDLYSLGQLIKGLLHNLTDDGRQLDEAPAAITKVLLGLPHRLQACDTPPMQTAPPMPHAELIKEIDDLIGKTRYRRIAYQVIPDANPIPWFEVTPETLATELTSETQLRSAPSAAGGQETALRPANAHADPGHPFAEFRDFDAAPLLISLPAGAAWIGSSHDEPGRGEDEPPPQKVELRPYALGKYPVTYEEWERFINATGKRPHAGFDEGWGGGLHPVIHVNLQDIAAYLAWLNELGGWHTNDPHRFRLPTPAEWEYAARAGTRTPNYTGRALTSADAHFLAKDAFPHQSEQRLHDRTAPVGSYPGNPWNFHDLLGNVWEWVDTTVETATGPITLLRGGSWLNGPDFLRASACKRHPIGKRSSHIGFRVARSLGRVG